MKNELVVQKLLRYTEKILGYCVNLSFEEFISDSKLVEACVFNLSQMGELCRAVDSAFSDAHPQIPWREMIGLRNRIVHDYDGVNLLLVWQIISDDLPALRDRLKEIRADA